MARWEYLHHIYMYAHVYTCKKMHPSLQDYILRWITSHFTSEAIQQCFYGGWSHEWKSFPYRLTSDDKIVINANPYLISFRKRYCMYWTYKFAKNNYRSLISPLSPRAFFSALSLLHHHSGPVTSHVQELLALWRHLAFMT